MPGEHSTVGHLGGGGRTVDPKIHYGTDNFSKKKKN